MPRANSVSYYSKRSPPSLIPPIHLPTSSASPHPQLIHHSQLSNSAAARLTKPHRRRLMSPPRLPPRPSAPKPPSTRSPFQPAQTGPPSPPTPSGYAPRRARTVPGARSPQPVRSARTPLALWVSNRLPLSRSTILTTGSCKPRLLTCGKENIPHVWYVQYPPSAPPCARSIVHSPHPTTFLHSQPSFFSIC